MKPKVSVIGAGNVGAEVARRVAEKDLADVVLVDVLEGMPQGKALDMLQAGPIVGYNSIVTGSNDFAEIKDSRVVVVTAGLARKPGMSRDDLLLKNAAIITSVCEKIKLYAPDSLVIIVTNPLDTMTYVAWKATGFPKERVMGMAPILDLARMAAFIALELKCPMTDVEAMVIGTHGDLMVPVPSQTKVRGRLVADLIPKEKLEAIVKRTQNGGAEIVALLKTGSAYYAPSAAAAYMVELLLKDSKKVVPVSVYADGQYGLKDLYIGLPAKLGKNGVEKVVEIDLTPDEKQALQRSAEAIKSSNAVCAK